MARRRVDADEIELRFDIRHGTDEVASLALFPKQPRLERAFDLALKTEKEGYNAYVSGPESIGRMTYTLRRLEEAAKARPVPEDICYYHDFDEPMAPKFLLLPAGLGTELAERIDDAIEKIKQHASEIFESKAFEEERVKLVKAITKEKERLFETLSEEAKRYGLAVAVTPTGIRLLPMVQGQVVPEQEVMAHPAIRQQYEASVQAFEKRFREYLRELRELDHRLADELKALREQAARFLIDNIFFPIEERFQDDPKVGRYLQKLKTNLVRHIQFFIEWKAIEENIPLRRLVENNINLFRLAVVVDNGRLESAPVVHEEMPTFRSLFGYISYRAEMGILYADHRSLVAGSLHKARGGYLVLRARDLLRVPFLWESLKRVLLHKKIHATATFLSETLPLYVGINPQPVPFEGKLFLIGDADLYHLLNLFDPEFGRLFKVKAEFDPVVRLDRDLLETFPAVIKQLVEQEGLKGLTADGVEAVLRFAVQQAGHRRKVSVVFGPITDLLREAHILSEGEQITGEEVRRALREKIFRANLIEEKIRELIAEGTIIIQTSGKETGQVNGLSVYDLRDFSFGKPTRITASVYPGEKGIIDIEREVELSGPIHSKGVMILSGYLGHRYGKRIPLSISCHLTFEQSYDEVEGDSASVAELLAILSAIAEIPLRQDLAVTGALDQLGNVQPVGGIREKIEGFFKVCRERGLSGKQGVVLPARNFDQILLDEEVIEAVREGKFHLYTVEKVDDAIELLAEMPADRFHQKVLAGLKGFAKVAEKKRGK